MATVNPVPLLFLTDSPDLQSGLARIGRDLATRVQRHLSDKFRVGYLGRGGVGGRNLPFPCYQIPHSYIGSGGSDEWGCGTLPQVWDDFAGSERGIVMPIWDPARLLWLSRPEYLTTEGAAKDFLISRPFDLWGYFPVDGHNVHGGLGRLGYETLKGFDRILAYGPYGSSVLWKTLQGQADIENLPHGIEDEVWRQRSRREARQLCPEWTNDQFIVGVVGTNQPRKDWGLAAEIGQLLKRKFGPLYRQWWHVDRQESPRGWSIPALLDEFDLADCTLISSQQPDDWMAQAYSACNVTLAVGAGEGFGFPIVESQACGTPVIHGNYAGGVGLVKYGELIPWTQYRLDGNLAIIRPVYKAQRWAVAAEQLGKQPRWSGDVDQYRWTQLWPKWQQWFEEGYEIFQARQPKEASIGCDLADVT